MIVLLLCNDGWWIYISYRAHNIYYIYNILLCAYTLFSDLSDNLLTEVLRDTFNEDNFPSLVNV